MMHLIDAIAPLAAIARTAEQGRLSYTRSTACDAEIYQGRGGKTLLTVGDVFMARDAAQGRLDIKQALVPLAAIADAYDDNALDDEARKFWGMDNERTNDSDPADIILVSSEGGATLLTLADAIAAREALRAQ